MGTKITTAIVLFLLGIILIFQNATMVNMKFLVFNFSIYLNLLIFISLLMGAAIVFCLFSIREYNYKLLLRSKNRQIANLKKENSKINGESFGKNIQLDPSTNVLYDKFLEVVQEESANKDTYGDFECKVEEYFNNSDMGNVVLESGKTEATQHHGDDDSKSSQATGKKISLSSLENMDFSLKSKSNQQSTHDDSEPWYMKPFFKREKKIEEPTIKKQETVEKKHNLDDLIKYNLDDLSINLGKNDIRSIEIPDQKSKSSVLYKKAGKRISKKSKKLKIQSAKPKKKLNLKAKYDSVKANFNLSLEEEVHDYYLAKKFKQHTSPENTLSSSSVKERFNWPSTEEQMTNVDEKKEEDLRKNISKFFFRK